jgi:hypothetical protein
MILSDERQNNFIRLVVDTIWNDDLVDYTDDDAAFRFAKKGMSEFLKEYQEIEVKTRQTISNLKRNVVEGSPEYDVLYSKYFEEELKKRNF